jgi:hypothetical protein
MEDTSLRLVNDRVVDEDGKTQLVEETLMKKRGSL